MDGYDPNLMIVRSEGVTLAERYLQSLCDHSFLSLWSCPGLYRYKKENGKGDGKELCDVLVVCGDDILIFSDKSCAFPDSGDLKVDWCRWFRKAVWESAAQTWGAERWIRTFPNLIFLDRACTKPFPLRLPSPDKMRVHHVLAAHNVSDCIAQHYSGSSPSLMFNSELAGRDHFDQSRCIPFNIGWLDKDRPFVHVLDDHSLTVILGALDTITDFVKYLRAKEVLLVSLRDSGRRFMYYGEEDLLAFYLFNTKDDEHYFDVPDVADVPASDGMCVQEGEWRRLIKNPKFQAGQEQRLVSYFWDGVIERLTKYIAYNNKRGLTLADRESALRFLARENRIGRQTLATVLIEMLKITEHGCDRRSVVKARDPDAPYYAFFLYDRRPGQSDQDYRESRAGLLEDFCFIAKVMHPDARYIVGFATETGEDSPIRSEDLIAIDVRNWTDEDQVYWQSEQDRTGVLTRSKMTELWTTEFPDPQDGNTLVAGLEKLRSRDEK